MPLSPLEFVAGMYPDTYLDDAAVIACQHILPTTALLVNSFVDRQLAPKNLFLIGKCYSTHVETFEHLQDMGVHVDASSRTFDSHQSFDEQFKANVQNFAAHVQKHFKHQMPPKLLVIDDGGHLLAAVNESGIDLSRVVGVEQTSSGYEHLRSIDLKFPVVNVARSRAKLEYESPFIAETGAQILETSFQKYGLEHPNILIIGAGYIGQALRHILEQRHSVSICDTDGKLCDFNGRFKQALGNFDVLVGTTGSASIVSEDLGHLRSNCLLASLSSSDREFPALALRSLNPRMNNPHEDINANGVILLNSGFPINFNGLENEAPRDILFTRGLLLAGGLQALAMDNCRGLVDFDEQIQSRLIEYRLAQSRSVAVTPRTPGLQR